MARRKHKKRGMVAPKAKRSAGRWQPLVIPHYGGFKRSVGSAAGGLKRFVKKDYLIDNFMNFGSVTAGQVGGNFIAEMVPLKQPLLKALTNIIAGLLVAGIAGKYQKIALIGAGIGSNGIQRAMKQLFPTLPYLSGESLEITQADVQRAVDTGAISQAEGAALLNTMSGEIRRMAGYTDENLLGTMAHMAGEGLETQFITTNDM